LPLLVTSTRNKTYGIFTLQNLQDFYNMPRTEKSAKNQEKCAKILARPRNICFSGRPLLTRAQENNLQFCKPAVTT